GDARPHLAALGVAGLDRHAGLALGERPLGDVEAQPALARLGVEAVAGEAGVREDRADVAVEVDAGGVGAGGARQQGGGEECSFHGSAVLRRGQRGVTRMLRKATGPWSPWNISGPVAASLLVRPLGVGPFISTPSWMTVSFSVTLTNFALATFLPPSNFGAWN